MIHKLRGFTIDWSDLENVDESPTKFPVVVEDILLKKAQSGIDYLDWELSITSEPHEGRRLHHITSLSTAARPHLWNLLRAFGIEDVKVTLEFEDEEVRWVSKDDRTQTRIDRHMTSPDLTGRAAIAVVENDSYEDRAQVRVVKLLPQT